MCQAQRLCLCAAQPVTDSVGKAFWQSVHFIVRHLYYFAIVANIAVQKGQFALSLIRSNEISSRFVFSLVTFTIILCLLSMASAL